MKRRKFIQATVGAVILAPMLPLRAQEAGKPIGPLPSLVPLPVSEAGQWFMKEPTRIGWFTLRFSDAKSNPVDFVRKASEASMNLICLTVGGSFAFYPSSVPDHEWAPGISAQHDFLGQLMKEARRRKIRVGARFDFSRQPATAVAARPDAFFTLADGSHPVDAAGRTPPCINGAFFRETAVNIMEEVVSKYQPSLVYFNNFGNNLGGQNLNSPCQCKNCKDLFRERTGKTLPDELTEEVRVFLKQSAYDTGKLFYDRLKRIAPHIVLINADTNPTEGWHSETRMVIAPSDLWLYTSSEAVNRQRTSFPASVTCNNVTSYSSNSSRLALMPPEETRLRLRQGMAHGSPPTYVATGTMDQDDGDSLAAATEVFHWHQRNQDLFGDHQNPARVLILADAETSPRGRNLVTQQSLRGLYRILTENHIPVLVSEAEELPESDHSKYDLVLVCPGARTNTEAYIKNGGRVLFIGNKPGFGIPQPVAEHQLKDVAYLEIRNPAKFPSLRKKNYLMVSSPCPYDIIDIFSKKQVSTQSFIEFPAESNPALSYVPPMIENPAEVSQSNLQHTNIPALLERDHGKGRFIYLPWDAGALYDRLAMSGHAGLVADLVDQLLPDGRQIKTNADSSVEIILASRPKLNQLMIHLINGSGQRQNSYMPAVPMRSISLSVRGLFRSVRARSLNKDLSFSYQQGYTHITIPSLDEYEVLVLKA